MTYNRNQHSSILRGPEADPQPCLPWDLKTPSGGAGVALAGFLDPAETPPERPVDPPGNLTGRNLQDHTSSTVARPAGGPSPASPPAGGRSAAGKRTWPCTRRRYATFEIARLARQIMMLNGRNYAEALKPVPCTRCKGWHLQKEKHRG